jgi:hypothetical protein
MALYLLQLDRDSYCIVIQWITTLYYSSTKRFAHMSARRICEHQPLHDESTMNY